MTLKIGLVAGETSGDLLGAGLIRALRSICPEAEFAGVAGPRMIAEGCSAWLPAENLAVFGLAEVAGHLPALIRARRQLRDRFLGWGADAFIGIDSPDFNLGLEIMLRRHGLRTVHYVSPSIWVWRPWRVRKIRRAADLVLCLLPFETGLYEQAGVATRFVGHPVADEIARCNERAPARAALGLADDATVIAVMPGSRIGELERLGDEFAGTIRWLAERRSGLAFVAPMAGPRLREMFTACLERSASGVPVTVLDGRAREAMTASDVVLAASGTATLEAALIKRPMVVAYRVSPLTRWVLETFRLLRVKRFALPNLISDRDLVPEILQDQVSPERLGSTVVEVLDDERGRAALLRQFELIHATLARNADVRAAEAVLALCASSTGERVT